MKKKKLNLNKEVIVNLSNEEMNNVKGGVKETVNNPPFVCNTALTYNVTCPTDDCATGECFDPQISRMVDCKTTIPDCNV